MEQVDVIVLGAGAAGLMAGIEAARRGRRVLVIDHAAAAGEKIRISGGGRCNFTNLNIAAGSFLGKNPRFALSALKRFSQWDFIARIDQAGIAWHEKTLGQLFCDGSAREVVAMLLRDLAQAGGALWLSTALDSMAQVKGGYRLHLTRGAEKMSVTAASVIVATGGKSIPKMGATGLGYHIAAQFGLPVTETRPALVPLTFAPQDLAWMAPMAGLSLPVRLSCNGARFDEGMLLTHRGLSGPAVLQISSYWREGETISVHLSPDRPVLALLETYKAENGRAGLARALGQFLPARMAAHFDGLYGFGTPMAEMPRDALHNIANVIQNWPLRPLGTEGYRTAEVTLGGVDTDCLDARTMQSKQHQGLYFVGEVVDITGWLGGYNFQWAWSSGWAAGQVA